MDTENKPFDRGRNTLNVFWVGILLVVLAVALELSIRIVVVPYTPATALAPWAIPTYGRIGASQDATRTIYLGNDDVHYVYLKPAD